MLPCFVCNCCCWFLLFILCFSSGSSRTCASYLLWFPVPKTFVYVSVFKVFRLSLSSNLPPAFSSLINLFYFIQLRGKINYYLFISPMFNNLLTCLSIDFYDHLVIALPKGFCVLFYFLFTAFVFFFNNGVCWVTLSITTGCWCCCLHVSNKKERCKQSVFAFVLDLLSLLIIYTSLLAYFQFLLLFH